MALAFKGLAERKRRRRSRRSREARKSVASIFGALSERRRRRRRSRRSREGAAVRVAKPVVARQRRRRRMRQTPVKFRGLGERRRRRSRRSRQAKRSSTTGRFMRRRARQGGIRSMVKFAARQTLRRRPSSAYMPMERRRRRSRRLRQGGLLGLRQANGASKFIDLSKKAAIASIGTISGRALSVLITRGVNRIAPNVSGRWVQPAVAAAATAGIWWLGGMRGIPGIISRNRELLSLGAALHFVEEILGLVLPMVGLGAGRGGMLGEAIYGGSLGGTCGHGAALGGCQYGCQWPAGTSPCPPCPGMPGSPLPYAFDVPAPAPGTAQPGPASVSLSGTCGHGAALGGCQYGCQWPAGTSPCPPCPGMPGATPPYAFDVPAPPPGMAQPGGTSGYGIAGDMALRKAGDAARDPFVAQMLAQRAAQSTGASLMGVVAG